MRFLLDENFPKAAAGLLKKNGHEVFDFRSFLQSGSDDVRGFEEDQSPHAVLPTTDRDFFHTIPHLFGNHPGVVVVALRQPNRSAILSRLAWRIARLPAEAYRNRVFQIRDTTWIAYPPLQSE